MNYLEILPFRFKYCKISNGNQSYLATVHAAISAAPPFHHLVVFYCPFCPLPIQPQTGLIYSHMGTGHFTSSLVETLNFNTKSILC